MKSGFISASIVAVTIGVIGTMWSYLAVEKIENEEISSVYPHHDLVFGIALLFLLFNECSNPDDNAKTGDVYY